MARVFSIDADDSRMNRPTNALLRTTWFVLTALSVAAVAFWVGRHREPAGPAVVERKPIAVSPPLPATFVGSASCASCHAREHELWTRSHHEQAMQPANRSTVLGDFRERTFRYAGIRTRLFRRRDAYLVETDGPDGALHEYEIAYTLGVSPLQQYLVAFPGGRLQALEIAWDSRPRAEGGERWFHLYPTEKIKSGDALHWTGPAENWNGMCADCHSTNVRKGYDAATGAFSTSYAELSIGCEACHGPGSRHVVWARAPSRDASYAATKGLLVQLTERAGLEWKRDPTTGKPRRNRPRTSSTEIQMCARCHSRRGAIHEDDVHGQPVGDDYRVALLDQALYHDDGQIRGEVYEYGSFLQSRMFAEGVTCSDCHEPHRPRLRGRGNEVCLQCHAAEVYQTAQHHFHAESSPGARCVSCHMPAVTYMVVDERRDHSFRVPRPDQSARLGVPNTCNACHSGRSPAWAERWIEERYGHAPSGHQGFAEALHAARIADPKASKLLADVVADASQPGIARATAIERLRPYLGRGTIDVVRAALSDSDALVRRAATRAVAETGAPGVLALAAPRLRDSERAVRVESAALVAGGAFEQARSEYLAAQELNADRPESHLSLASLWTAEQKLDAAESELARALTMDPTFAPAAINLADLYRSEKRDGEGEPVLRSALLRAPDAAPLWEAWGLWLVRQKRLHEALEPLGRATRLAGDVARYRVVYATALHESGRPDEAIRVLREVLAGHPYDRDALSALEAFQREKGNDSAARECAARLRELASE